MPAVPVLGGKGRRVIASSGPARTANPDPERAGGEGEEGGTYLKSETYKLTRKVILCSEISKPMLQKLRVVSYVFTFSICQHFLKFFL